MDDGSSRLRIVTPPGAEPVTLAEAKLFLRIEYATDDDLITRTIAAARQAAEQYLKSALLPQAVSFATGCVGVRRVGLPFGPATAIDSVTVTSHGGADTVLDETLFRLSVDGFSLFFDKPPVGATITVAYHASLADTADALPALLKQGLLHHVAAMTQSRDGAAAMPVTSLQCYQPFRRIGL